MKAGDLIYWHGRGTLALVIFVEYDSNILPREDLWACLLEDDGMLIHDDLAEGYTVINDSWDWPGWHINHKNNKSKNR